MNINLKTKQNRNLFIHKSHPILTDIMVTDCFLRTFLKYSTS